MQSYKAELYKIDELEEKHSLSAENPKVLLWFPGSSGQFCTDGL